MVGAVLPVAPVQCGMIQVSNVPENPPNKKVLFHKSNQPFHFALRKGMPGLAEPCLKPDCFHKGFVVLLPDGMPLKIPVENNTLHIVCQDILGDAHISKGVDHANEEILLFRIREELYIPLTAVVTDHGKAGNIVFAAVIVHHFGEAPVYLVGFSRLHGEEVEMDFWGIETISRFRLKTQCSFAGYGSYFTSTIISCEILSGNSLQIMLHLMVNFPALVGKI